VCVHKAPWLLLLLPLLLRLLLCRRLRLRYRLVVDRTHSWCLVPLPLLSLLPLLPLLLRRPRLQSPRVLLSPRSPLTPLRPQYWPAVSVCHRHHRASQHRSCMAQQSALLRDERSLEEALLLPQPRPLSLPLLPPLLPAKGWN
jgi:hypothetical protein